MDTELIRAQGEALWNANLDMLAAADRNMDGVVTISDLWLLAKGIFFLPGNYLLTHLLMHMPDVAIFWEIDAGSLYGFWAGALSVLGWMIAIGVALPAFGGMAIASERISRILNSLRFLEVLGLLVLVLLPFFLSIFMVESGTLNRNMLDTALILAFLAEIALVLFYWRKLRR
ncbi:hypothetical protein [Mesorhizobium sp.]|uniref:hypothetical protein n=1 Tax=Mesorhizobium sp. TaxID=1871066 RepID=UPI000FE56EF4|nr:hypothetical protein [Mesorhizobium sp.]RWO96929.1 MAG: hypothetical protein EOQ99_32565 [Mesorhizobium sp.]